MDRIYRIKGSDTISIRYDEAFIQSLANKRTFRAAAAEKLNWIRPWDQVPDDLAKPFYRWFIGGFCNTSCICLDRYVDVGHGDDFVLVRDSTSL